MIAHLLRRARNRATWLRFTYPFQFAHGPLCDRYRDGAVRLGHVFLCRSCLALYGALVVATPLVVAWSPTALTLAWAIGTMAGVVLMASWPPLYRKLPRWGKDVARAGAGVLAALVLAALLRGAWWVGGIAAVTLALAYFVFARVRRAQRVHMCDGCPELGQARVCSGYARQAKHLDRYEEVMAARCAPRIGALLQDRSRVD